MTLVYSPTAAMDYINFMNPGPVGIALFKADTDIANCTKTYLKGKETGNQYLVIPMANSIDAVDIVKQKTPSADDKRFTAEYDAGFTYTNSPETFACQAVARKVVSTDGERKILKDTNNSSDDFESLWNVQPRVYDVKEAATIAEFEISEPKWEKNKRNDRQYLATYTIKVTLSEGEFFTDTDDLEYPPLAIGQYPVHAIKSDKDNLPEQWNNNALNMACVNKWNNAAI